MIKPRIPSNEDERIEKLKSYDILDTIPEEEYDALTFLASQICGTPISLISLVDPDRQWFKSRHGLDASETPRNLAFCAHAINNPDDVFLVENALEDQRFFDNPLTTDAPNVVFYAGAPLNTSDGYALGTICVIDHKPKKLTDAQLKSLKMLADQVMAQFELRKKNNNLEKYNSKIVTLNQNLQQFATKLTHDLKAPVRSVKFLIDVLIEDYSKVLDIDAVQLLNKMSDKTDYLEQIISGMLSYSKTEDEAISYQEFNVSDLINDIESALYSAEEFNVKFNSSSSENIRHYKFGVLSVIQNLMSNSIKFNDEPTCLIEVGLEESEQSYILSFEDNGPGIPEAKRDSVFNLFENLNSNSKESTGIGLATVKAIVEKLKGSIVITERLENKKGAKFVITLPKI